MKKALGLLLALFVFAALPAWSQMTVAEVTQVIQQAATRARQVAGNSFIAVLDREGYVLGVWAVGAVPSDPNELASKVASVISKAGTAVFLSSTQEALTSRSAGFIVQQHFPPGINNKPPGPLVGVNFSNLPFSDVNFFKDPATFVPTLPGPSGPGGTNGAPIPGTSLSGTPGGMPLYKNGNLIGGIGVTTDGPQDIQVMQSPDVDEGIALAGQVGFAPREVIRGSHIFIDGIRVPYVNSTTVPNVPLPLASLGMVVLPYNLTDSPAVVYPTAVLGGVRGEIRSPIRSDPAAGLIDGQPRLQATEVQKIIAQAAARARKTRSGIRLPAGRAAQVFISVVSNPNSPGVAPEILGTFRTPDATVFSWDVSVQKARTAVFFSDNQRAFSSRTVGFLSQSLYPPGIINTAPGPFLGLQEQYSGFVGFNVLNGVTITNPPASIPPNPNLPNGITIFPGGFPLYRKGVLIGAIGVSGDGIDQDDLISAAGTVGFVAPAAIRADRQLFRAARLPYAKFPRNPAL